MNPEYLNADELIRDITFKSKTRRIRIGNLFQGHLITDVGDGYLLNLEKRLDIFFENERFAVLTADGLSMALWKMSEKFWMFDSHSRDENGNSTSLFGTACLMSFASIPSLMNVLLQNVHNNNQSELYPMENFRPMEKRVTMPSRNEASISQNDISDETDSTDESHHSSIEDANSEKYTTVIILKNRLVRKIRIQKKKESVKVTKFLRILKAVKNM